ncbi:hypothetical protein AX15_005039 [Amanita polypyramis BW_CC]|nr:hypothetical protein AX15_005039 [Amanita polypyramis BW_CC]
MSSAVNLYVYDLSSGLAKQLSRQLIGRQIDGIWHTSIVVFGREYFYGRGINVTLPGQSHHGSPLQTLDMGETSIDEDTFNDYIEGVRGHYTADKYHLMDFNCNSFTNDVIGFLTGQSIPGFIKDLPTDFLSTPFGAALRPVIDVMYSPPSQTVAANASSNPQSTASILEAVAAQAQANYTAANGSTNAQIHDTESLSSSVHVITNQASLRSFLSSHKAAVAFFTSATCGPCQMIEPVFMKLAQDKGIKSRGPAMKGAGFAIIDIDVGLGHSIAAEWRVTATPTFIFFFDGDRVQEIKGADSVELNTQVDLLLFQAYPPHPHTKLSLPFIQKISFNPILFTQVPSIDAVTAKLDIFIDSAIWPGSASYSKAQVKAIISNTASPYFKARFSSSGEIHEQLHSATPAMLSSYSQASSVLINALHVEGLFPLIDLWRLLVLDPATGSWIASQSNFDDHPLSLLLANAYSMVMSGPRNYVLTLLRLFANVFASPGIAQRLVLGVQKQRMTMLIIQTLLHDDAMIRNASASLIFNLSAALQRNRVESIVEETSKISIQVEESEDWEVEVVSAIVEALRREKENEGFVHRLTAALAFVIRFSPFWSSLESLLQVLQCREVLESKLSQGGGVGQNTDARKVIREVAHELIP